MENHDTYGSLSQALEGERSFQEGHLLKLLTYKLLDYAVFLIDQDGTVATWNLGAERTTGYSAEEIIGKPHSIFYSEEDASAGEPALALSIASREGRHETQGWRFRKDGERFWADMTITAIRDNDGNLLSFANITRDLTELTAREEALGASESRFKMLVDSVTDYAIYWLDPEGRIASWNAGAQRIKGYTAREIVGRPYSVFFTSEDRKTGTPERLLREARIWGRYQGEGWRVRQDGSQFWASVVLDRICGVDGTLVGFAKITRDDTVRRHSDDALREARRVIEHNQDADQRALEAEDARVIARDAVTEALAARGMAIAAAQEKSSFFAGITHDLRQPVQALRLFVDVLAVRLRKTEYVSLTYPIEQALASTEAILASFLDVARINSGAVVPKPQQVDLANILHPLVTELKPKASAKGLDLRYVGLSVNVYTDPILLRRIVQNLIENAVKYTMAGRILVGSRRRGRAITIEVWDTGPGIGNQHLQHIWDEHYQVNNPDYKKSEGFGLGLSIVQKLATILGHRLEVVSEVGKGSVFRVILEGKVPQPTIAPSSPASRG